MSSKTKTFLWMTAVLCTLISCQKSYPYDNSSEIRFGSKCMSFETKAFMETVDSVLKADGFRAAGVVNVGNTVMFNDIVKQTENIYTVPGQHYYFPEESTMSFYAVYPITENIVMEWDGMKIYYHHNPDKDLIGASKLNMPDQKNPVQMEFKHLLTQVSITIKKEDSNDICKLKSVSIKGINAGKYNFKTDEWFIMGDEEEYSFLSSEEGIEISESEIPVGPAMSFIPEKIKLNAKWENYNSEIGILTGSHEQTIEVELTKGEHVTIALTIPANSSEVLYSSIIDSWKDTRTEKDLVEQYRMIPMTGIFRVNDNGKTVSFFGGNLFWNGQEFRCERKQYHYVNEYNEYHVNHFFWSRNAEIARAKIYEDNDKKFTDTFFAANGGIVNYATVLTKEEWEYLFEHNLLKNSKGKCVFVINNVKCALLEPSEYYPDEWPERIWESVPDTCTAQEWEEIEYQFGLVALPYEGYRVEDGTVSSEGISAMYWSSNIEKINEVTDRGWTTRIDFDEAEMVMYSRDKGMPVRLITIRENF